MLIQTLALILNDTTTYKITTTMKVIWNIIRWIFGVTFCLASIGGFASGDIGMAFFVLALGLLFLPPVTKSLFKKKTIENNQPQNEHLVKNNPNTQTDKLVNVTSKKVGNNTTEMTISLNEENLVALFKQQQQKRDAEIKNFNYVPMQIQRQGIQLLESINILNTTKNLDTLIGRYDFITKMYDDFVKASHNKRYISDIQLSIDQYKTMYYDKLLKDYELKLLVQPDHKDLKDYYTECLFNSFKGFYKEQIEQIENLKKDDAKQRRKEKIIEIGNQTIFEFDKNGSDNDRFNSYLKDLKDILENLGSSSKSSIAEIPSISLKVNNPIVINPKSSFELTLYNADQKIIQKVTSILKDENTWNKSRELLPIFSLHDIKCKEVDEYILKYKTIYEQHLQKQIGISAEYQNSTEKDKEIIEEELKEIVLDLLPERADCDLKILFECNRETDFTIDNQIVEKYGFDVISKYFGLSYYKEKIVSHWERKDFEDLLKADLIYTAEEIEQEEILNSQTLKTLNIICNKEEGHFKRKNKAIEYLNENKELLSNIGKFVATRNLFKIKPLPNEFQNLDIEAVQNHWAFLKEYTKLIADTYRNSERNNEDISGDKSWVKGFRVEKFEDLNSNFVCLRAREECKKKYSKSNPPKLPFHIGCNCDLRTDV